MRDTGCRLWNRSRARIDPLLAVGAIACDGPREALEANVHVVVCLAGYPAWMKVVEVFQEQQPGDLLGVVELTAAAGLFPEDVIKVLEGLFEMGHGRSVGSVG